MSTDIEDPIEQTAASLVSGILGDLQHLVEQQFQLTRQEIEDGLRRRAAAAAVFGLGVGCLFLAAIALTQAIANLLHCMAIPNGTDPGWLPLWACHAVVAAILVVSGVILACVGRMKFRSLDPLQNSAIEILQEYSP